MRLTQQERKTVRAITAALNGLPPPGTRIKIINGAESQLSSCNGEMATVVEPPYRMKSSRDGRMRVWVMVDPIIYGHYPRGPYYLYKESIQLI